MKYIYVILISFLLFYFGYTLIKKEASGDTPKISDEGDWGEPVSITPKSQVELASNWILEGDWAVESGKLKTVGDYPQNKILLYKTPITGSVAFEFKAKIVDKEAFEKGRDLSVVLLSSKDLLRRYDLQVLAGTDKIRSKAIIQMVDVPMAAKDIKVEVGKEYLIRGELDGDQLRLFVDSKLILESHNKYFLNGSYHGIYSYGGGKEFWDIKIYRKSKRYHADPLKVADLHLSNAFAFPRPNNRFFSQARNYFNELLLSGEYESKRDLILLRLAIIERETKNLDKFAYYLKEYSKHYRSYLGSSLKIELLLLEKKAEEALKRIDQFLVDYPENGLELAGVIKKMLTSSISLAYSNEARSKLWSIFYDVSQEDLFFGRNLGITNADFLKGRTLDSIRIGGNELTDINFVSSVQNLSVLQVPKNKIEDISVLKGMTFIQLILDRNPIKDLTPLAGSQIKKLILRELSIEDYSPVSSVVGLEELNLNFSEILDFSFLKTLKLKIFSARSTKLKNLSFLNKEKLISMDCAGNNISKLDGRLYKNLKRLTIANNQISSLVEIAKIPLTRLDVSGNPITSLSPYYKKPPKYFFFDCPTLSEQELEEAIKHWKKNKEAKNSLSLAKTYLSLRRGKTDKSSLLMNSVKSKEGHSYFYFPTAMSWNEARSYCEGVGGHLVTISSKTENNFVKQLPGLNGLTWIGLEYSKNTYQWSNDEFFYFADFSLDNTNVALFDGYYGLQSMKSYWQRIDKSVDTKAPFIIEWEN